MLKRKNIVIITGGPGFGKSSLIESLSKRNFRVGGEAAREIIAEQCRFNGDILPWKNSKAFQQEVLMQRIKFWESVGVDEMAFADRGIPDQMAFAQFRGFDPSFLLRSKASAYQYYPDVFICPPWREIYRHDSVRKESFEEACQLHQIICRVYSDLGYQLIDLPLTSIAKRIEFILRKSKRP